MRFFKRLGRDGGSERTLSTLKTAGHPKKVSIVARWDFDVRDPDKVIAAARSRLVNKGYDSDDAVGHTRDVEMALLMLFELDGWEPSYEAIGLEFAGSAANVASIKKTIEDGDDATDIEF